VLCIWIRKLVSRVEVDPTLNLRDLIRGDDMDDNDAWRIERRLWLEGSEPYREVLDEDCIMAFPAPVGLLRGRSVIIQSLHGIPRWEQLAVSEKIMGRIGETFIVLGYLAEARRGEDQPYAAYCTSTYHGAGAEWKLIQHQQTPVDHGTR